MRCPWNNNDIECDMHDATQLACMLYYDSPSATFRRFASGLPPPSPSPSSTDLVLLGVLAVSVCDSGVGFGFSPALGVSATVADAEAAAGFGFFFMMTPFKGFLESFLASVGPDFGIKDGDVKEERFVVEVLDAEVERGGEAAGGAVGGVLTITRDAMALGEAVSTQHSLRRRDRTHSLNPRTSSPSRSFRCRSSSNCCSRTESRNMISSSSSARNWLASLVFSSHSSCLAAYENRPTRGSCKTLREWRRLELTLLAANFCHRHHHHAEREER